MVYNANGQSGYSYEIYLDLLLFLDFFAFFLSLRFLSCTPLSLSSDDSDVDSAMRDFFFFFFLSFLTTQTTEIEMQLCHSSQLKNKLVLCKRTLDETHQLATIVDGGVLQRSRITVDG